MNFRFPFLIFFTFQFDFGLEQQQEKKKISKNAEIMKDGNNKLCEQWNLVLSKWMLFDEDIPQEKLSVA